MIVEKEYITAYDKMLLARIKRLLSSNAAATNLSLKVSVIGRVVHLEGSVKKECELTELRDLLSGVKGIYSVWDTVSVSNKKPKIIDIGCGSKKQVPWATGVDKNPGGSADVICNLEKKLPFKDGEFHHAYAVHILEHVVNLCGLMNEIHRILKPEGVLHIIVPDSRSQNAVADPTHVRFFNIKTIKFFCKPYPGLLPFRPVCAGCDKTTVYADLIPLKNGEKCLPDEELSYYFEDE